MDVGTLSVCVASASRRSVEVEPIKKMLGDAGHTVLDEHELRATGRADTLVYVLPSGVDANIKYHWMSLANLVRHDVLICPSASSPVPAETVVPITNTAEARGLAEPFKDQLLAAVAEIDDGTTVPRLISVGKSASAPDVAGDRGEFVERLSVANRRVVAVTEALLQDLARAPITSRRDYDLSRFARWASRRLNSSYVKLQLSLTGSDSPGGVLSKSPASLVDVMTDVRTSDLVVLRGVPGSGKSVQMSFLETHMAVSSIRNGSDPESIFVFCVNLGDAPDPTPDFRPATWLEQRWRSRVHGDELPALSEYLVDGQVLLLLDGFNEIPFRNSRDRTFWMGKWKQAIYDEILANYGNRVIVACRPRDLVVGLSRDEVDPTFVDLQALDTHEILSIAAKVNPSAARDLSTAIAQDGTLTELYQTPFALTDFLKYAAGPVPRTQGEIFWHRIVGTLERERNMKESTLLNDAWLPLPAVNTLLDCKTFIDAVPVLKSLPLFYSLGQVARSMTEESASSGTHRTSLDTASEFLPRFSEALGLNDSPGLATKAMYDCVDLELLTVSDGIVRFDHQTLQDFFAALNMSDAEIFATVDLGSKPFSERLGDLTQVLSDLGTSDQLAILPSTGYEEVFARAAEIRPTLLQSAASLNPWLVAENAHRAPTAGRVAVQERVARELQERLAVATDFRERAACLLGLASVSVDDHGSMDDAERMSALPDILVDSSLARVGCNDQVSQEVGSSRFERMEQVGSFFISRYPVTNGQYARFVADNGYSNQALWSAEGWQWRSGLASLEDVTDRWIARRLKAASDPRRPVDLLRRGRVSVIEAAAIVRFTQMTDPEIRHIAEMLAGQIVTSSAFSRDDRLNATSQPVVGVSFHEALAYCRWLSSRSGRRVRLPSESEWEVGAMLSHGLDPRLGLGKFSFPQTWNYSWGNTAELHLGRTSPVASFKPQEPNGIPLEMSGNVFEWVTDPVEPGDLSRRVVKGGSWRHLMRRAHPAYRGQGDTTTRNDDNGFRVAMDIPDRTESGTSVA